MQEKQRGGQPANRNAQRHGMRSGQLPVGCEHIANSTNKLRRSLEDAVMQRHGSISVVHAAAINAAARHETRACMLTRWLKMLGDETVTPLGERINLVRDLSSATELRNKAIDKLGIEGDANPWQFPDDPQAKPADANPWIFPDESEPQPEAGQQASEDTPQDTSPTLDNDAAYDAWVAQCEGRDTPSEGNPSTGGGRV